MSTIIDNIERAQLQADRPVFEAGDRVRVHFQVIEGSRRRTQVFEGVVIRRQGSGARETFTVRKKSFGVGVERTFPLHSPKIENLEVAARGDVRRAKLYYLRDRVGKAARVTERRWGAEDQFGPQAGAAVQVTVTDTDPAAGEADAEPTQEGGANAEDIATEATQAAEEETAESVAEGSVQGEAEDQPGQAEGEGGSESESEGKPSEPSSEAAEDEDADKTGKANETDD